MFSVKEPKIKPRLQPNNKPQDTAEPGGNAQGDERYYAKLERLKRVREYEFKKATKTSCAQKFNSVGNALGTTAKDKRQLADSSRFSNKTS